jgi:hypothetical protein
LFRSVPMAGPAVRAVPLAAVIPSRVPQPAGPGPHGRVRVREGRSGGVNPQPAANALILMQLGKLYDDVGLRLTEKDRNDWILALDLLIEAALTRVAVTVTAT